MPSFITTDEPLATHTTLGVGGSAEFWAEVTDVHELEEAVAWAKKEGHFVTILGGGSNVLVDDEGVSGLVIKLLFQDISYTENGDDMRVTAGSGLILDDLVGILVEKKLWGLENLSGIPGMVGAVPIQNVGAYGVEAKDVVHTVEVFDTESLETKVFTNAECNFGYRDSIFKREEGKKYIVTHVTFHVSEKPNPNIQYPDVLKYFGENTNPSIQEIRKAIKSIRDAKFPGWRELGTAGSFFKNPTITKEEYENLKDQYPDIPGFEAGEEKIKVPLGWILDHVCGLKGYTEGNVGLYKKQALVLICEKGATAKEIKTFVKKISEIVKEKTNIEIEPEVTML